MVSSSPNSAACDAIRAMASDVFVLGYPLVLTDAIRRAHPIGSGQILSLPEDPRGLAPGFDGEDPDTVLTSTWIDVEAGPVVLRVPNPGGRHFTLTFIDSSGRIIASFGAPTGHAGGGDFVIAGPERGQDDAAGSTVRAPAGQVWAVTRITATSAEDRPLTRLLAARQRLSPVGAPAPAAAPPRAIDAPAMSSAQRVVELAPDAYLHRLGVLLDRLGAAEDAGVHAPIRIALDALLTSVAAQGSTSEARQAVLHGFEDGLAAIRQAAGPPESPQPGEWRRVAPSAGATPLSLAAAAFGELGAPSPADVLSLSCRADETGRDLNGTERYRIHFPPGDMPPVEAFWSITVSPGARGHDRTSIGSRNTLAYNRDGSLDLILQPTWPGAPHASNWLAIPERPFVLTLKMYWPRPEALEGAWRAPTVERLGSRFARRSVVGSRGAPTSSDAPDAQGRTRQSDQPSGTQEMR